MCNSSILPQLIPSPYSCHIPGPIPCPTSCPGTVRTSQAFFAPLQSFEVTAILFWPAWTCSGESGNVDYKWLKWNQAITLVYSCGIRFEMFFLGLWISRHNMAELWNSLRWLQLHPRRSSTQFTKIRCHGILGPQVFRPTPRWTTISARLCRRSVYQYKLYS